jgi:hypothetical protein
VGTVEQVTQRTGDPSYLSAAMAALDRQRTLWGLDAPRAKPKDDGAGRVTVSEIAARLAASAEAHEAETDGEPEQSDQGGDDVDRAGGESVPERSDPVQPDDSR